MEIERKFLLENLDFLKEKNPKSYVINQGYLFNKNGTQVRVRIKSCSEFEKGYITAKSKIKNNELRRDEYEMEISPKIAKTLLANCTSFSIYKIRHVIEEWINRKCYIIEIDEFQLFNSGLLIAEIEFKNEKEAHKFNPKLFPYLGKEVTDDPKYKNDYLNKTPYTLW